MRQAVTQAWELPLGDGSEALCPDCYENLSGNGRPTSVHLAWLAGSLRCPGCGWVPEAVRVPAGQADGDDGA